MYMLDTNIIVKAIRQKNHPVWKKLLNHIDGALCISSITYTELMYGVYHSQDPKKNLSAVYEILFGFKFFHLIWRQRSQQERLWHLLHSGVLRLGIGTCLLPGTRFRKKFPIVTHNVREFERVTGLQIEDWLEQYPSL